jgi:hypothetical protein
MGSGAETRTEYRVVGDPDSAAADPQIAGPFRDLKTAQHTRDGFNPIGMSVIWRNVRIQSRTVTETPWTDLTQQPETETK